MEIAAKNIFSKKRGRPLLYWLISKLVFIITGYAALQSFFELKDFEISNHMLINEHVPTTPSIILFRIIGNSLPPLHSNDQSISNLKFMIYNEKHLGSVKKVWILNRIIDPLILQELTDTIEKAGDTYFVFTFNPDKFLAVDYNHPYVSKDIVDAISGLQKIETMTSKVKSNISYFFLDKNRHLMNNNGARNFALELGIRLGYTWILPWDGNCYITENAWPVINGSLRYLGQKHKYFLSYMIRVTENDQRDINKGDSTEASEEPQIIFRSDAKERFDDMIPYGRRSKVALLIRLKIPGDWNDWRWYSWERNINPHYSYSNDSTNPTPKAGFIIRLSSGVNKILISSSSRFNVRLIAIVSFIIKLDIEHIQIRFRKVDGLQRQSLALGYSDNINSLAYVFYRAKGGAKNDSHIDSLLRCLDQKAERMFREYLSGAKSKDSLLYNLQNHLEKSYADFVNVDDEKIPVSVSNVKCMKALSLPTLLEVVNVFTLAIPVKPKYRILYKVLYFLKNFCQRKSHSTLSKASASLSMLSITKFYPELNESGRNFWLAKLYASLLGSSEEFVAIRKSAEQSEIFVKYVVSLAFISFRYDLQFGQLKNLLRLSKDLCDYHGENSELEFNCWLTEPNPFGEFLDSTREV